MQKDIAWNTQRWNFPFRLAGLLFRDYSRLGCVLLRPPVQKLWGLLEVFFSTGWLPPFCCPTNGSSSSSSLKLCSFTLTVNNSHECAKEELYALLSTVYYLRWHMPPFMCQVLRPTVGPVHETAGTGKLINAALLSLFLMRRMWVYAVLPSSRVNSSACLCVDTID